MFCTIAMHIWCNQGDRSHDTQPHYRGVGSYFIVVRPFQKKESMKNIEYSQLNTFITCPHFCNHSYVVTTPYISYVHLVTLLHEEHTQMPLNSSSMNRPNTVDLWSSLLSTKLFATSIKLI